MMRLSDLPARELARLDAVCLEFERQMRQRPAGFDWGNIIHDLVQRHGGEHAEVLRKELQGIQAELRGQPVAATPAGTAPRVTAPPIAAPPIAASPIAAPPIAASPVTAPPVTTHSVTARTVAAPPVASKARGSATAGPAAAKPSSRDAAPLSSQREAAGAPKLPTGLPTIGTQMGPYLLTSVLGQGGMGVVYRATDTRLDRSVAIKMLAVGSRHAEALTERFQREAKAVAALSNPHIVELFDVGVFESMPYAVMEHLRGETLMRRMDPKRIEVEPISIEMVRVWGLQLADALTAAHAAGVIHRDLKPENVMLLGSEPARATSTPKSAVKASSNEIPSLKLFDFGLSRVAQSLAGGSSNRRASSPSVAVDMALTIAGEDSSDLLSSDGSDSKTRAGMILGTPGYMAPEQARGEMISPAVDVFSLGCVLYEAFYGTPAFSGSSPARRYAAVLETQPPSDPMRRRDDPKLADLIVWMLRKKPTERPLASQVAAELRGDRASSSGRGMARPLEMQSPITISRRRVFELVGGGMAGALLGVTALPGTSAELRAIRSIGVLSLRPAINDSAGEGPNVEGPVPAGGRDLLDGELLAGLLVNELSHLKGISVPKYVPLSVDSLPGEYPEGYRRAARLLEVDALVTGTFAPVGDGASRLMDVNLQIISGTTGKLIDGLTVRAAAGDNLIEQTSLAREVAERIGQTLTPTDEVTPTTNSGAFTCLVKGRTYADPDSVEGLRMALACFKHALSQDPQYGQALAGLALTSITLAAQTAVEETANLIAQARESSTESLRHAPDNPEARLAQAMLAYQTLSTLADFDTAEKTLSELVRQWPNLYQAHHQYGWLKLIKLDETTGLRELRLAAQLHPSSSLLRTDLARAQWFRGYADRAISEASVMLDDPDSQLSLQPHETSHPRGLLIDIYEHTGRFDEAAELDEAIQWRPNGGKNDYFASRQLRLSEVPYGPFGPTLNQAILNQRRTDTFDREPGDRILSRLAAAQAPMLGLLLTRHPAMASLAMLPIASEIMPVLKH